MDFYFMNVLCALFAALIYVIFRSGVHSYLRINKNSKTFIRKNTRGYANFWFYKNLKPNLGRIYYLNLILLFGTAAYIIVALSLAWIDILRLPIAIIHALLCAVQITALVFSDINSNKQEFGTPIVIWRKSSCGCARSSVGDLLAIIGLVALASANVYLAVK